MAKGSWLFKSFPGSWTFKELADGEAEVIFLYSFTLRFRFTLLTIFVKHNLQNNVKQRLVDLKKAIEIADFEIYKLETVQFIESAIKNFFEM